MLMTALGIGGGGGMLAMAAATLTGDDDGEDVDNHLVPSDSALEDDDSS